MDLSLDPRAMELAVGKSVNREDVTILPFQPFLKGQQGGGIAQPARRLRPQTQADGVGLAARHPVADGQGVGLQRLEGLRPVLASVNVRAVGQMQAVVQFHAAGTLSNKRNGGPACSLPAAPTAAKDWLGQPMRYAGLDDAER